jgi:hypothetical protein
MENYNFAELEEFGKTYPSLTDKVIKFVAYLKNLLTWDSDSDIYFKYVEEECDCDKGIALALLHAAHKAEILDFRYDFYCPQTGKFLITYKRKEDFPESVKCTRCISFHNPYNDCDVDVIHYFYGI